MCEENKELELNEEEQGFDLDSLSREELMDVVSQLLSQKEKEVEIDTDNVSDFELNRNEFKAGIDSVSFIAGQFSCLNSVGYPVDMIHEMILNRETIEHNQYLQKINNESSEKIAKTQEVKIEQSQI